VVGDTDELLVVILDETALELLTGPVCSAGIVILVNVTRPCKA